VISLECTTGPIIMKDLLYIFCKNSKIELTKSDYIIKASIIAWERTTAGMESEWLILNIYMKNKPCIHKYIIYIVYTHIILYI
jgi:hypothetical protein